MGNYQPNIYQLNKNLTYCKKHINKNYDKTKYDKCSQCFLEEKGFKTWDEYSVSLKPHQDRGASTAQTS